MMNSVANGVASEQEDDVKDYFVGLVSDRAKPCVDKAIDYTLLVVTLALQYFRCKGLDVNLDASSDNMNVNVTSTDPECDFSSNWTEFSDDKYIKVLIWALIGIGISYGIIVSALIWIHSSCVPDMKIHKKTANLYKCTDRIFLIDSILEIPKSFIEAPIITVSLWSAYTTALGGLYFLTMKFGELVMDDKMKDMNAKNVFVSSAVLVAISLYKFTGEVSQYWVLYTVSKKYAKEDDSKTSTQKKSKVKVKAKNFEEDEEVADEEKGDASIDASKLSRKNPRLLPALENLPEEKQKDIVFEAAKESSNQPLVDRSDNLVVDDDKDRVIKEIKSSEKDDKLSMKNSFPLPALDDIPNEKQRDNVFEDAAYFL